MNILDKIINTKRNEVKVLREKYSRSDFEKSQYFQKIFYSLINEINCNKNISIIAEIKKASPSKGLLKENFNHLEIAKSYFENNVNGISILTDKKYFQGKIKYLRDIAEIKSKPLLRKDFIIDEFQILEAKANGADAILLIAEALTKKQIRELTLFAKKVGVEILLELHAENQLNKIDFGLNTLIGINNRNLDNFVTTIETTEKLSGRIPNNIILVSESGINTETDVRRLKNTGIDAVLVGEFFMRTNNIDENIKELKRWCEVES